MSGKVFSMVIVILAILVGILACVVPMTHIMGVLFIMKFFQAMIPILGVGALVKYIMCHHCSSCSKGKCD